MRKMFFFSLLLLLSVVTASAQSLDKELQQLIDIVKMMRNSNEATYNKAIQKLKDDNAWTPMTETGGVQETECTPSSIKDCFRFNKAMSSAEKKRKQVSTHGDMLNGEDSRYNYSMFERVLKSQCSATYKLKGREGVQTFAVVPYKAKGANLTAEVTVNNEKGTVRTMPDGVIIIECNSKKLQRGNEVRLVVTNKSKGNQAFVILNHNTRKR